MQSPPSANNTAVLGHELTAGVRSSGSSLSSSSGESNIQREGGFFPHAQNFTLQDSTFFEIHGNFLSVNNYHGTVVESVAVHSSESPIETNYKLCPPPTPLFTGRKSILKEIEIYFRNNIGTRHVCVLHGLGGVGKSQIAYQFVEISTQKHRFSDTFFVDASTVDTINTDLQNIAQAKRAGKSAENALRWLANRRQEWLILFNNADDVKLNLSQFFPLCSHGNILITTRNPELCVHAPNAGFKIVDLEMEDAVNLLLAMVARNGSVAQATEIVKEFYCHPLAVVQAGAYIAKSHNLGGYLALYKKNQTRLWQTRPVQRHDNYQWTVYTTWQMSINLLPPAAATFLRICSFMHHDGISEQIFENASASISSRKTSDMPPSTVEFLKTFLTPEGVWDSFIFQEMVNEVQSYSLINYDDRNKVFSIHPLVHAWMRTTAEDRSSTEICVQHLVGLSINWRYDLEDYKYRQALQPHIDAVLGQNNDISVVLMVNFALAYWENGCFSKAEKLLVVVMEARKRLLGEEHPDTLGIISNLAVTYLKQGRFDEAEKLQVALVESRKRVLGEEHPDTLSIIGHLTVTYSKQGRFDEAEKLQVALVESTKRVLGEEHPDTLSIIGHLSATYRKQGRFDEAEKLQVALVESMKRVLGEEHPSTLNIIANLAATYMDQGRFDEAEKLQVALVESRKRVLGEEHPSTLNIIANLAATYMDQGRFDEAEKLQVALVESRKRVLGEEHPDTLKAIRNLASTHKKQHRFNKAKSLKSQWLR